MTRRLGTLLLAAALFAGAAGTARAEPNAENASCMGLGSYWYAQGAGFEGVTGVRADIAHLVKESFAAAPGTYLRGFAQEKEGGSIPAPCGARIE
jgi:hypothetical protein